MIALITGASAGFGKAIAKTLLAKGHKVIICARRNERLQQIARHYPHSCYPLSFDISDEQQSIAAIKSLPDKWQEIDLLVNNAGLARGIAPAHQCSLADWKQMIDTNISGLLTLIHCILPQMVKRNRGHIINIGSIAGDYPYPGGNVYGASKAFVKQLSLNLRADLLGTQVRVSNVEPGLCGGTEFSKVRFDGDLAKVKALYADVDYLSAEDIAEIVVWIAERPAHVNINRIEIMPVAQAPAALSVARKQ